ncbi:cation:proton antiporter [Patulibacter minatonensis]|uniref:cation:proton antiporter n=1 Tax=Patulibacter minatonensis TaxID=298163 RepID=UPI0004B5235D|nr:cation:proton antiporter [Patulibacter minatonensis]
MLDALLTPLASEPGFHPGSHAGVLVFVLAGAGLLVATIALSNQGGRTFTSAIVYLVLGVVAALGIAAVGGTPFDPVEDADLLEHLTEVVAIIALFGTGMAVDRPLHWRAWSHALRLLLIAMPLTIAAVTLFGWGAMGLSLGAALMLGGAVAPTDPVLAGDLGIGPPGEPDERDTSFALTAEAGFNDGLAYPFVLAGIMIAHHADDGNVLTWLASDVLWAIAVGVLCGVGLGWLAARIVREARDRGFMQEYFDAWVGLGVVLGVYGVTEILDAYGFIAAFVAGIAFRRYERDHEMQAGTHRGASVFERLGELAVVLFAASMLTLDGLGTPGLAGWGLVVLVVFVIRPAAGLVATLGTSMRLSDRAFIAFFGVRGVGSLFYAAVVVTSGALSDHEAAVVLWTVVALTVVSIVVHGLAGDPARRRLDRIARAHGEAVAGDRDESGEEQRVEAEEGAEDRRSGRPVAGEG